MLELTEQYLNGKQYSLSHGQFIKAFCKFHTKCAVLYYSPIFLPILQVAKIHLQQT